MKLDPQKVVCVIKNENMTLSEIYQRLEKLGYVLRVHQKNALGKRFRYRTSPNAGGGPTNYFNDKAQLERYIVQVEQVRQWQQEHLADSCV